MSKLIIEEESGTFRIRVESAAMPPMFAPRGPLDSFHFDLLVAAYGYTERLQRRFAAKMGRGTKFTDWVATVAVVEGEAIVAMHAYITGEDVEAVRRKATAAAQALGLHVEAG